MFTPKQLQDFIDAPRAPAAFLEGRGHIRADVPVAAPVAPSQRVHTSQPRTGTIIKQIEAATGRPATRVTRLPDGSTTVEVGTRDDATGARDASVVAMDRIAALRRVK